MPQRFIFQEPNKTFSRFECDLESKQCQGYTQSTAKRCKRNVVIGLPFCWSHLLNERKIRIKQSSIPQAGKGLFVEDKSKPKNEVVFQKNSFILEYNGEKIDRDELVRRYGKYTAPYGVELSKKLYEDAACKRGAGAMGNYSPKSNAILFLSKNKNSVIVVAKKNIRNSEEIFIDYGKSFRFDEGTFYTTKRVSKNKPNLYG
jgi:hypothetical protein